MFNKLINNIRETIALGGLGDSNHNHDIFEEIIGHELVKKAFNQALASSKPLHIMIESPPGCGKTRFLKAIQKKYGKKAYFFEGTNSTKAGCTKYLLDNRPRYFLVDEIEKMGADAKSSLLSLTQDGMVSETKAKSTRSAQFDCWVFATCNNINKVSEALRSRFFVIKLDEYNKEEFCNTAAQAIKRKNKIIDQDFVYEIARQVYDTLKEPNIRDVEQLFSMCKSPGDFEDMLKLKSKGREKK